MDIAPRINLISACAGQKSGTGTYLGDLLNEIIGRIDAKSFRIVSDLTLGEPDPEFSEKFEIIDFTKFLPDPNDINIVFLANNPFHQFCLHLLRSGTLYRPISVLHDLSILGTTVDLCSSQKFGFSRRDMLDSLLFEFPDIGGKLFEAWDANKLPVLFWYITMCQKIALEKSSRLLVHSRFAKAKLIFESQGSLPPIDVGSLPFPSTNNNLREAALSKKNVFVIGCFGWIAPPKRPFEIVRAFADFVTTLSPEDRALVQLKFVGELTEKRFDPKRQAKELGISDCVHVTGYVPNPQFNLEISETNLILNLRFPSHGETSGTLRDGAFYGVPTVTTKYQAFAEMPSHYKVSFDRELERKQLYAIMQSEFDQWRNGKETSHFEGRSACPPVRRMSSVICDLIESEKGS